MMKNNLTNHLVKDLHLVFWARRVPEGSTAPRQWFVEDYDDKGHAMTAFMQKKGSYSDKEYSLFFQDTGEDYVPILPWQVEYEVMQRRSNGCRCAQCERLIYLAEVSEKLGDRRHNLFPPFDADLFVDHGTHNACPQVAIEGTPFHSQMNMDEELIYLENDQEGDALHIDHDHIVPLCAFLLRRLRAQQKGWAELKE